MRADVVGCRVYFQKEALGQWNCLTDPKRDSIATTNKSTRAAFCPGLFNKVAIRSAQLQASRKA